MLGINKIATLKNQPEYHVYFDPNRILVSLVSPPAVAACPLYPPPRVSPATTIPHGTTVPLQQPPPLPFQTTAACHPHPPHTLPTPPHAPVEEVTPGDAHMVEAQLCVVVTVDARLLPHVRDRHTRRHRAVVVAYVEEEGVDALVLLLSARLPCQEPSEHDGDLGVGRGEADPVLARPGVWCVDDELVGRFVERCRRVDEHTPVVVCRCVSLCVVVSSCVEYMGGVRVEGEGIAVIGGVNGLMCEECGEAGVSECVVGGYIMLRFPVRVSNVPCDWE